MLKKIKSLSHFTGRSFKQLSTHAFARFWSGFGSTGSAIVNQTIYTGCPAGARFSEDKQVIKSFG